MSLPYGERIKHVRAIRGMTQRDLGQLIGVSTFPITITEQAQNRSDVPEKVSRAIEAAFDLDLMSPEIEAAFAILSGEDIDFEKTLLALARLEAQPG